MEWGREKCLQLVDIYEEYPVLWNPKHGFYYNKLKKHDAWVSISTRMNCGSQEVKKKMESMLASFSREKAKRKNQLEPVKLEEKFTFLLGSPLPEWLFCWTETNQYKQLAVRLRMRQKQRIAVPDDDQSTMEDTVEPPLENQTSLPKSKRTGPTTPAIAKRVKKKNHEEDNTINEALDLLKSVAVQPKAEISDACSDYGKHVANKLRSYSERSKALVQYHINNILFQADMGQFDINRNPATAFYRSDYSTTPVPTPSPQETIQSNSMTYTDLSSPLSAIIDNPQPSTSNATAARFLSEWQAQCDN